MGLFNHKKSTDALFKEATKAFERKNYFEAYDKFLKCAAAGSSTSEYNLAVMFAFGHGVERNMATAEEWAQKSWDHGRKEAKDFLAFVLRKRAEAAERNGDTELYMERLSRSAELGDKAAMTKLAEMKED